MADPWCPPPQPTLLSLPVKLRLKIYHHIFEDPRISLAISGRPPCPISGISSILRVCRLLRAEALPVCYNLASFLIESENHPHMPRQLQPEPEISSFDFQRIEKIVVKKPVYLERTYTRSKRPQSLYELFPRLQQITWEGQACAYVCKELKANNAELRSSPRLRDAQLGGLTADCSWGRYAYITKPFHLDSSAHYDIHIRYKNHLDWDKAVVYGRVLPSQKRADRSSLVRPTLCFPTMCLITGAEGSHFPPFVQPRGQFEWRMGSGSATMVTPRGLCCAGIRSD